ncbi:MAG: HAMP domain-containing histidine kinase [Planctomycetales bacterium]|nr:HAMP domain-containing histidine kinase [Planctomycetales bacterium]
MVTRMLIRKKILLTTLLLTGTLLVWMYSSLYSVYAYRNLSLTISQLAAELKTTSKLRVEIDELMSDAEAAAPAKGEEQWLRPFTLSPRRDWFVQKLNAVEKTLHDYESQVRNHMLTDPLLADRSSELASAKVIRGKLNAVRWISDDPTAILAGNAFLKKDFEALATTVQELPMYLLERMENFRGEVRNRYRALIIMIFVTSIVALVIVVTSFWFFRHHVVQPFKTLLSGSRQIAQGQFDHRIHLHSQDELSELAGVMNEMTERFLSIKNNLNETVQQRTREVVRSEQLASVGFLAAGVAHEINNPLASIAWSAEALESRLHEILHSPTPQTIGAPAYDQQQIEVLRKYLKRIQDEAFRCKGITERLLDFSRLGESQRKQQTDISQSIADVIELVKHLGQYRNKSIEFHKCPAVLAWVSPTEFKQVVLNLLTNSLDACHDGGLVQVSLVSDQKSFTVTVTDNGCGMTDEVLTHLFEPFFTRRRDGRGTGLGLSITYRIVQDHEGSLVPASLGDNQGSTFTLNMPLQSTRKEYHEGFKQAAA